MKVYDLNRDQLTELKQRYYTEETGRDLSYEELANIDDYVSDEEIQDVYYYDNFVNDDFFCTAGQPDDNYWRIELDVIEGSDTEIADTLREIATAIENDYSHGITSNGTNWSIEKA